MKRLLNLDDVPDGLLAEFGFSRGVATERSYRCTDASAVLVPLVEITAPMQRRLNEEALRNLLRGMRDDADIPAVVVSRGAEAGATVITLLDGMHRLRVSFALGFTDIPTIC